MSTRVVEYTNHFEDLNSSAVEDVHYDAKKYQLFVTTVRGDTYGYESVPAFVFWAFKSADSRGAYWNNEVKRKYRALPFSARYEFVEAQGANKITAPAPVAVNAFAKSGDEYTVTFTVSGTITITGEANGYDDAVTKATKVLEENMVGNFTVEGVVKNK